MLLVTLFILDPCYLICKNRSKFSAATIYRFTLFFSSVYYVYHPSSFFLPYNCRKVVDSFQSLFHVAKFPVISRLNSAKKKTHCYRKQAKKNRSLLLYQKNTYFTTPQS